MAFSPVVVVSPGQGVAGTGGSTAAAVAASHDDGQFCWAGYTCGLAHLDRRIICPAAAGGAGGSLLSGGRALP